MTASAAALPHSGTMDLDEFLAMRSKQAVMMAPPSLAWRRIALGLCELLNRELAEQRKNLYAPSRSRQQMVWGRHDGIELPQRGLSCLVADLGRGTPLRPRQRQGD